VEYDGNLRAPLTLQNPVVTCVQSDLILINATLFPQSVLTYLVRTSEQRLLPYRVLTD